jgi:hypothetical protein
VTYVCRRCTSAQVTRDAWATWDFRRQRWTIDQLFDTAWCHACGAATTLIERKAPPGQGIG